MLHPHRVTRLLSTSASSALFVMMLGCQPNSQPVGTVASVGSAPSTVVDIYGVLSQNTSRPVECQVGADGPANPRPSVWWQGVSPSVRQAGAVVGYQTWSNTGVPAHCPNDFRTDIYRAFFTVDLSQWAGRSGAIIAATLKLTALAVPGITPATVAASRAAKPNSEFCDAQAGGAFQVFQIAGATVLQSGLTELYLNTPQLEANPPIPNSYPAGPLVFNFPNKNPSAAASLGQPTFTADITQLVMSALQANVTTLKFMITGTNEPPARKDSPLVPQTDCKAIYSLGVDVRSA